MSWLKCDGCGDLINTDNEPEAYDQENDTWTCEDCREAQNADSVCATDTEVSAPPPDPAE